MEFGNLVFNFFILLFRPMDFLECDPPVDLRGNVTAREESGYGCTKVSSYSLQLKAGHFFQAALHVHVHIL